MERAKGRRRAKQATIALIVAVMAIAGIGRLLPRERLLLKLAHPVVNVDSDNMDSCWLSSDRLLLVTTDPKPGYTRVPHSTNMIAHWRGSVDVLNTSTHTRTNLSALTKLFEQEMEAPWLALENVEASPDGTWVRWSSHAERGPFANAFMARLDGTYSRDWDASTGNAVEEVEGEADFFLDSAHFVRLSHKQPFMVVYDLLAPSQDRKYWKLEQAQSLLSQYAQQQPVFCTATVTEDGSVELDTYRTEDRPQLLRPQNIAGHSGPTPIRKHIQTLPEGATVCDTFVSPQQWIVYHFAVSRTARIRTWLHRILPNLSVKPIVTEELWVSRADGTGMHEIGHIPVSSVANAYATGVLPPQEQYLNDIQWLPDGKQISFVYHDSLYVVPVDMEK